MRTAGGIAFSYPVTVIDLSRRLVGWSIADYMRAELVEDAWGATALTRGGLAGAVFRADPATTPDGGTRTAPISAQPTTKRPGIRHPAGSRVITTPCPALPGAKAPA
ncbi:hypothetical protein R3Q06_36310, partial [Rhodococcus erythropolis]|nr:hypothetical protein [Rhodococcus erythropolis]